MSKKLKDVGDSMESVNPGVDATSESSDAAVTDGGIGGMFDVLEEIWDEEDEQERLAATRDDEESDSFDLEGIDEQELQDFLADLPEVETGLSENSLGDWGLVSWGIEVARNEDGSLKKAQDARDDPANLVLYGENGEVIASVLLTPPVHSQMMTALGKVGKLYEDPIKNKVKAGERWDSIVQWHLNHKFLGSVSALFTLAFIAFMVIGFITIN